MRTLIRFIDQKTEEVIANVESNTDIAIPFIGTGVKLNGEFYYVTSSFSELEVVSVTSHIKNIITVIVRKV